MAEDFVVYLECVVKSWEKLTKKKLLVFNSKV